MSILKVLNISDIDGQLISNCLNFYGEVLMADCECLSGCPFFNDKMANMPAMKEMFKRNYCMSDYTNCARYMIFKDLGKQAVPSNLFPNQKEKALEILKNAN